MMWHSDHGWAWGTQKRKSMIVLMADRGRRGGGISEQAINSVFLAETVVGYK